MLVLPPTTLSARTAQQRSVDSATLSNATGSESAVQLLGSEGVDTSEYGVKDWAALIRQTTDTTPLVGKQVRAVRLRGARRRTARSPSPGS